MTTRQRLPNRRLAETFDIQVGGLRYVVSIGRFADGTLAELFISNGKAGSDSDANARDAAIIGVDRSAIRRAARRAPKGTPSR